MKLFHPFSCKAGYIVLLIILILSRNGYATETPDDWRSTYDLIMKWVNFFILIFIFIKYARTPLKNFFRDRKAEMESEIRKLESEKQEIAEKVKEAGKSIENSDSTIAAIKERIQQEGERERDRIIREAREQSKILLESARRKAGQQVLLARDKIRFQLVDSAIALAMERIPTQITREDHQRFIEEFTAD
jgi:F-type H+-transporting ATPase subunit b